MEVAIPEKVILFGSYAKGKWVDDVTVEDGVTFIYQSDFDFLVVTKDNSTKEFELKSKIENEAVNSVRGIVSPLVHSIDYINEGLSIGQYFFKEIIEEGILLFDTGSLFHQLQSEYALHLPTSFPKTTPMRPRSLDQLFRIFADTLFSELTKSIMILPKLDRLYF